MKSSIKHHKFNESDLKQKPVTLSFDNVEDKTKGI